jgi:hypothetical protein
MLWIDRLFPDTLGARTRRLAAELVTMIDENIATGRCNDHPLFWVEQRTVFARVRDGR